MFNTLFPTGIILVILGEVMRTEKLQSMIAYKDSAVVRYFNAGGIALLCLGALVTTIGVVSLLF